MRTRFRAALAAGGLLFASACSSAPSQRVTWRESWEWLILTSRGQIVDARVTVGNTGLLRGQGHVRLNRWMEEGAPIVYRRLWAPGQTAVFPDRTRVRLGSDRMEMERLKWTLELHSDTTNAVVHLAPTDTLEVKPSPTLTTTGQWTTAASIAAGRASGWVEAGERGGQVDGRGVLLYRAGDGMVSGPRQTLVLMGADVSVGLDTQGDHTLAWVHLDGEELDATGARLAQTRDGWMAEFPRANLVIDLRGRNPQGSDPLNPDEMFVGQLGRQFLGQPATRTIQAVQATLSRPGGTTVAPGLLVQVAEEADRIALPVRRRP